MENSYTYKMTNKSDSELLDYVNNRTQFQADAVIAAIIELDKRGKADSAILGIKKQIEQKIENRNEQIQQSREDFKVPKDLPKTISNAAKLIYLTLGIGIVNSIIMELTTDFNNISDPKNLFVLIISLGLMAFFAYKIHMGKKWARTTFLVLFLIGMIMFPFTLIQFFQLNPLTGIISLTQTGLQIYALILLYKPDSKDWYVNNSKKETDD
jgi:tryptophan-rich sensory protein